MALVSFSRRNLLYIILLSIVTTGEMKLLQLISSYPQILFMFLDSLGLFLFVLIDDLILIYGFDEIKPRISLQKMTMFNKQKITVISPNTKTKEKERKFIIAIFLLSLLTSLNSGLNFFIYLCLISGFSSAFWVFNMLFTWLLLFFWLKLRMHRHHVLAMIILFISLIASFVVNLGVFGQVEFLFGDFYLFSCCFVLIIIALPSRELIEKYVLDRLFVKYTRLLFFEGLGSCLINILIFGIVQLINCNKAKRPVSLDQFCISTQNKILSKQFIKLFSFRTFDSLFIWLYFLSVIGINYFRIHINRSDGPSHRYSGDLLAFVIFMLLDSILETHKLFDWEIIVILFVLIIGCLLYNENIRLNFCQFSRNTRFEIERRAKRDGEADQTFIELNPIEEIEIVDIDNMSSDDSIINNTLQ